MVDSQVAMGLPSHRLWPGHDLDDLELALFEASYGY